MGILASELAEFTSQEIVSNPGQLLEAAFALIEHRRDLFQACLR
jgi:hypothetical protein